MADVKGDLAGISQPGSDSNKKVVERVKLLKLKDYRYEGYPVAFWDIFGKQGHPVRATVSEMGPLILARLFDLSETQSAVLSLVFKIADDHDMDLLDLKDLHAMLQFVGNNAQEFRTQYGNITGATVGAIQRSLLTLQEQGGDNFFGEPVMNPEDILRVDSSGRGLINVFASEALMMTPKTYAAFLLWFLSEMWERLPEVGDAEKPRLVFFFEEAHLLFKDVPKALLERIEQVLRMIRSKGVGVYFVTHNPLDIPKTVRGQLSNRIQHALRAFTPADQKAVKALADTFRTNTKLDVEEAVTQVGVGEALVSMLGNKGMPGIVERAFILPPRSQIGPIPAETRQQIIKSSPFAGRYEKVLDRESAYEKLQARTAEAATEQPAAPAKRKRSKPEPTAFDKVLKAINGPLGRQIGREVTRNIMGAILRKKR
jgi:DNA helicase HerA-like ATPase